MGIKALLKGLFSPQPKPHSYYTTDGHNLAPYPNMTDDDLYDFECHDLTGLPPERRTWDTLDQYLIYSKAQETKQRCSCGASNGH